MILAYKCMIEKFLFFGLENHDEISSRLTASRPGISKGISHPFCYLADRVGHEIGSYLLDLEKYPVYSRQNKKIVRNLGKTYIYMKILTSLHLVKEILFHTRTLKILV